MPAVVVVYLLPWPLLVGGVWCSRLWSTSQLLRPSGQQCSHSSGVCPQIQGWQLMWCVCWYSWRDDVCRVGGCYRGDIVMMDVFWRQLCVSMIWGREICLFWAGQGWGRRVRRGSLSSELLVGGGGVRSILLLPLVARCLETVDA